MGGLFGVVATLHVLGFGLFLYYRADLSYSHAAGAGGGLLYAGAAGTAYALGLRHAFDADHIAAIDDTTRYLLQKGQKPLGGGLAFSLGHSTVVLSLCTGIAFALQAAVRFRDAFAEAGAIIGTLVSGTFLYLIAGLNIVVLAGMVRTWRAARAGCHDEAELNALISQRGLMNRIFKGRYNRMIRHSWQLFPVGLLFGLGFDTATQVGAIAIAAGVAAGGSLPPLAIIALPLIFAAGMSLMDTADGVFMTKAYGWALTNPIRKIYYNLTTTGLSVLIAFVVGTLQLLTVLSAQLHMSGAQPFAALRMVDFNLIGILVVAAFVVTWLAAVLLWKVRGYGREAALLSADGSAESCRPESSSTAPSVPGRHEQRGYADLNAW